MPRKSSRLAISSSGIASDIFSAAFSTLTGYLYGRLNSARIAFISALFSPAVPKYLPPHPAFLASSGHSVIRTIALSPVLPPFNLSFGIKISFASVLSSVIRNANPLVTCSLPVINRRSLSSISITSPSGSAPFLLA